jgi:hypothetical protein
MGSVHRASSGGGKAGKGGKASGGGGAAKARVHLAQPAVRRVTGARAERSTHRHKKLFTDEPGALAVRSTTATLAPLCGAVAQDCFAPPLCAAAVLLQC